MIRVTVSDRFADPPICLYDPESRICFIPGKLFELDERHLTVQQRSWLEQDALVVVQEGARLDEMSYVDLYRKAKEAGLRYPVRPKKVQAHRGPFGGAESRGSLDEAGGRKSWLISQTRRA
jgi:hypothetical protein